jgi:hypothetical protein
MTATTDPAELCREYEIAIRFLLDECDRLEAEIAQRDATIQEYRTIPRHPAHQTGPVACVRHIPTPPAPPNPFWHKRSRRDGGPNHVARLRVSRAETCWRT